MTHTLRQMGQKLPGNLDFERFELTNRRALEWPCQRGSRGRLSGCGAGFSSDVCLAASRDAGN